MVTLSLMILLTIIAVGLLTLSSISLRASTQSEAIATARANARLALMLAIGDLQKTLGPDKAISANSEILAAAPAKPNLTGVWKSWDFNPNTSLNYTTEKENRFQRWLVSKVDVTTTESPTFATTGWTGNTIELVGAGSLWAGAPNTAKVTAGLVPLFRNGKAQGSYAWHVADESAKARINLYRNPVPETSASNVSLAQKRSLLAGQRPDPSLMKGADDKFFTILPKDDTATNFTDANVSKTKIINLNQAELLTGALGKIKQFRNDVTPYSLGVMCDVRHGGLKQDLSSVFEMNTSLPTEFSGKKLYESTHGISGVSDPYWKTLSGYYNVFQDIKESDTNVPTGPLKINPTFVLPNMDPKISDPTPQSYFAGPVIAKVEMVFSLIARESHKTYVNYKNTAIGDAASVANGTHPALAYDDTVNLIFSPQVTLHNPYNVNISFDMLEVTFSNVPIAFRFTLKRPGFPDQVQSVNPSTSSDTSFESLNQMVQDSGRGDKKFVLRIADWDDYQPSTLGKKQIVMKPGQTILCTPYLNPTGKYSDNDRGGMFDYNNNLTGNTSSGGIKAKPGYIPGLGFEIDNVTGSCQSCKNQGANNWWMFFLRDVKRDRTSFDPPAAITALKPAHPNDEFFLEYKMLQPGWWIGTPDINKIQYTAPNFTVSAKITAFNLARPVDYAKIEFNYTDNTTLNRLFNDKLNNKVYRCPPITASTPVPYIDPSTIFVKSETQMNAQAGARPFAVFSAYAKTTNGGVYDNDARVATSSGSSLLKDGRMAGKPALFHNLARGVSSVDLAASKPSSHSYELNLQAFDSKGIADDYLTVSEDPVTKFPRVPALTGNTTSRGIKSGSYLELPIGPMQTIADFRRSNALASAYLPNFVQPVGNSLLHPLMSPDKVSETNLSISPTVLLDHSVLANHALYDRFYFSTFSTRLRMKGTNRRTPDKMFEQFMAGNLSLPLDSQAFQPYLPAGDTALSAKARLYNTTIPKNDAYKYAAEYQMIQGAFNVNSTSVQAWKAMLGSTNKAAVPTFWAKSAALEIVASTKVPIVGMSLSNGGAVATTPDPTKIDDVKTNDWNGYRELNDTQLNDLAKAIVEQVRTRGPFLSMSEFVNRRIGLESPLTLSGALENAIADSKINDGFLQGYVTDLTAASFSDSSLYDYKTKAAALGNPAAGAPGWVSQGDLLRILEPAATVRSDTFVIRVCGEAQDANGKVTARVYAEAVVQRVPDYLDSTDRPSDKDDKAGFKPVNKTFGRRMNVISFRWLANNEI